MNLHIDLQRLLRLSIILAFLLAFLGGKFSFSRFVADDAANPWLELRAWFTVCCVLGVAIEARLLRQPTWPRLDGRTLFLASCVFALHGYLIMHLFIRGNPAHFTHYGVDLLYVIVHAALILFVIRTRDDLLNSIYFLELIGFTLIFLAVIGVNVSGSRGWYPFGSSITFYRIEFLMACGALLAFSWATAPRARALHLFMALVGLFATLTSQAKVAVVFSFIVGLYWIVSLLAVWQPRRATLVAGLFVVAASLYSLSTHIEGVNRWSGIGVTTPDTKVTIVVPGMQHRPDGTPIDPQAYQDALDMADIVILQDRTQRITMFQHAWELFDKNKLWGIGFGNFQVRLRNSERTGFAYQDHPHNIILEVLAAAGLIGGALFGFATIAFIIAIHQIIRDDVRWVFFAGYPLSVMISALFAGDIFDYRGVFFIGLAMSAVVATTPTPESYSAHAQRT